MLLPDDLMERIYATLQYYGNQCTYEAPRTGGVLAGCPRGPKPTSEELTIEARKMVRQIDAALTPPNDRVEGRDAALSRRVPSHDGLEG